MQIHRVVETIEVVGVFKLDNKVTLTVFDGFAIGSDGKTYYCVGQEDSNYELVSISWSSDIRHTTII